MTTFDRVASDEQALSTERKERMSAVLRYVALGLIGLVMLYPMIWLVGASFKSNAEVFTEIGFWPSRFDFSAYAKGWKTSTEYTFATYFLNSFLIIVPKVIVTVISCVLVAYAFARFEFWGKKFLFSVMVGTMMLPLIILRLPQYLMFKQFDWIDSYLPLIVPSAFATDTFFVFMLVQFLRGIPRDMEEAAQIDGCNPLQLLWHILVPILKPAIISVIVFQFIWTMNDFMGPLIYLSSVEKYPVSLALKMSIGATEEVEWASVIAISVVALIPSVVVFFLAQRHFIEGAASSGIKG
ncbi:MAG: carbohydrate ABC transporter permease [Burkholderiaceae bacterium]|uniref:carbohydrate ABC transporter permease n=1 Tax=Acidovorax sp. 106 TaxID=2135637 RepID=UPI000EB4A6DC|nr:carbohydrate ABC transporter permease [Acidovorax sp. 106]MBX9835048.1 carbohydrate ABC transporter permease [Burkholderiaceae bacterium]MCZ8093603.1 carbohydrate ABC transporter permease [Acidovorax sp.]RLJ36950.1 oligogalacturonide ABC transporter membrane protein [Acidovorax sp. 106]